MPIVAELPRLLEGKTALFEQIPHNFEHSARYHEATIRFSTVPISHRLPSLLREINSERQNNPLTEVDIVAASRPFELSQIRWQSIRTDDELTGAGVNPTGWEHLYMGTGWNHNQTALRIAQIGLDTQREHKSIINTILTGGIKALNLLQLVEADIIIENLLAQEKALMSQGAREFREKTLAAVTALPADLQKAYYYKSRDGQIIAVSVTLQRLPPHPTFRRPVDWQTVYHLAQQQGLHDASVQDLQRGRTIIELLSHGMGSFTQGFLTLAKESQRQ